MADRSEISTDRYGRDDLEETKNVSYFQHDEPDTRSALPTEIDRRSRGSESPSDQQHTFDDLEPRTDSATTLHTLDEQSTPEGA
jgi:hypothetical protein